VRGFENRWKHELAKRKPEILTKARAEGLSGGVLDVSFKMYEECITK